MKIKDERVLQLNNKIQIEAYLLVIFLAVASIFLKSYVMEMHFTQYVTELAIIILSTFYISIRGMFLGYHSSDSFKYNKILKMSAVLILSLAVSISNGIKNYSMYNNKYTGIFDVHFLAMITFTFASSAILISFILILLDWMDKAGQRKIGKKLLDDEQD